MSEQFFRIFRGLELDETIQLLQGAGDPGSAGGDTDAAPVGSFYLDNLTGNAWTKATPGAGTGHWSLLASQTWVNNVVGANISWREPVTVIDTMTTTLPTGASAGTIDGVTLTNGDRVLFTGVTPANVYVYNATTQAFTQDVNALSQGDTVYVDGGTSGGTRWTYNGTAWVRFDAMSLDELAYIRNFIGKSAAGNIVPTYTSTLVVSQSSNLVDAVSALDAEVGAQVSTGNWISAANKVNQNLQALDTELGANVTDGFYILAANKMNANIQVLDSALGTPTGTHFWISDTQKVNGNLIALDAEIGANVTNGNFVLAINTVNQNIQALDTHLGGAVTTGAYVVNSASANTNIQALDSALGTNVTNGNFILSSNPINTNIQAIDSEIGGNVTSGTYILSSNSINQNIQAIDVALTEVSKESTVSNVTTATVVDSINATVVKWIVKITDTANSANVYSAEVFASSNGLTADFTKFAVLKHGSNIPGLTISAALAGSNLQLSVASTATVNVTVRRVSAI
ncbi:MAG: hypothetical protein QXN55_01455 [Candidatus Nitrosotenuis sp.]